MVAAASIDDMYSAGRGMAPYDTNGRMKDCEAKGRRDMRIRCVCIDMNERGSVESEIE